MKRTLVLLVITLSLVGSVSAEVPRDFYVEVSKGNVPGHSIERLTGINEAVGTVFEDIICGGGSYVYPVAAVFVNVSSSDVDDVDGGAGAWNVTIEGLDINWEPVSETVQLNGQTNVTSVEVYYRINHFYVRMVGASGWNEGAIMLTSTNMMLSHILAEHGMEQYARYSVPLNCWVMPFSGLLTTNEDKAVRSELQTRVYNDTCAGFESWTTRQELLSYRSNTVFDVKAFNLISGKTDIKLRSKVGSTTGEVGATLNLLLIEDSVLNNSTILWEDGTIGTSTPNYFLIYVGVAILAMIAFLASRKR